MEELNKAALYAIVADKVPDEAMVSVAAGHLKAMDARIAELKAELTACRQSHVDVIASVIQRTFDAVLALPRRVVWEEPDAEHPEVKPLWGVGVIRVSDIKLLRKARWAKDEGSDERLP